MANSVKYEQLASPPAMEAVFEITVAEAADTSTKQLLVTDAAFRERFPTVEEVRVIEGTFQLNADQMAEIAAQGAGGVAQHPMTNRLIGYSYKTADAKEIVQFRKNGFTYNILGDYPGGDQFIDSVLFAWKSYLTIYPKLQAVKLGLRFINVLSAKGFDGDYSRYFNVFLNVPKEIGIFDHYQYRYSKDFKDCDCTALVNFGPAAITDGTATKFILDIDLLKLSVPNPLDQEALSKEFALMRDCKNSIFFATLTEELLKSYR